MCHAATHGCVCANTGVASSQPSVHVCFVCVACVCLQLHEWAEMKLKKMNEDDAGISADAFQVGVTILDMYSRQYVAGVVGHIRFVMRGEKGSLTPTESS